MRRGEDARHRRLLRFGRDVHGALNQRQLRGTLDLAHREQQSGRVAEPDVGVLPAQFVGEPLLARRRAAEPAAIVHDEPDVGAARAHRCEKRRHRRRREVAARSGIFPRAPLKQRVEEAGDAAGRRHLAHAGLCGDLLVGRNFSRPAFVRRIAIAREDHLAALALSGKQDERRLRLVQAGEVEQVVFLAERPVDVAGAARRLARERDEHGVGADRFCQRRAPRLILRGRDPRVLGRRLHGEKGERPENGYRESHGRHDNLQKRCARSSAG